VLDESLFGDCFLHSFSVVAEGMSERGWLKGGRGQALTDGGGVLFFLPFLVMMMMMMTDHGG
jgi:hypothetical protein